MKLQIITGGQTGIDRMALEVAKELGLVTGGTAPLNYWTENGEDLTLKEFNLVESKQRGYLDRTRQNIQDSHGTIIFGDITSPGSKRTIGIAKWFKQPLLINPVYPLDICNFIINNRIEVLNVAGNRASKITKDALDTYRLRLKDGIIRYKEWLEIE